MHLHGLLAAAAPDAAALWFEDRLWSFADLDRDAGRVAAWVAERTSPGDRVALLGRNRPEYVAALYGIPRAGRIAVPLNHRLTEGEQRAQAAQVGAEIVIDGDRWEEVVAGPVTPPAEGDDRDVAWLLFTSGTTGRPRAAMLTHRSLLAAADGTLAGRPRAVDDVYLFPFPLCHVAAYNVLVQHRIGRPLVLLAGFDAGEVQDQARRHAVTSMSLAPTMVAMLLDDPGLDPTAFTSVRQIAYGASAMDPDLRRRAAAVLDVEVVEGYGMTEASGNAVFDGRPSPAVELRIVDGEIQLRGPQVMAGYWEDPTATAEVLADGWLRTGDLGRLEADGRLQVVDRRKDIVVTGGENVSSREVEDVLATHPGVRRVAVVAVPDERWGEAVCAVVVPADAGLTLDDLVAHSRAHLAGFKRPRHLVTVAELPVNAAGKVRKADLRALATKRVRAGG